MDAGPKMSGLEGGRGTDCVGSCVNWGFTLIKKQEATEEFYVGDEMTWLVFAAEDASEGGSESRDRLRSFWAHHGRQGGKETDRMMGWTSHVTFATSLNKVRYKEADETEKDGIHLLSFSLS